MIFGRDRQCRVRAAASGARSAGDRSGAGCEGRGDRGPAAPADGVAPAGRPTPVYALGSAGAGGVGEAVATGALVGVPGHAGHVVALAPGPGPAPVDLSAPSRPPARTGTVGRRSGAAHGSGEPAVGISADRRRVREARCHRVCDLGPEHPAPAPARTGPAPERTELEAVPAGSGRWGACL